MTRNVVGRIEAAAKEATEGPWKAAWRDNNYQGIDESYVVVVPEMRVGAVATTSRVKQGWNDATHIANMDPGTTLRLVAVVRAAEAIDLSDPSLVNLARSAQAWARLRAALDALNEGTETGEDR